VKPSPELEALARRVFAGYNAGDAAVLANVVMHRVFAGDQIVYRVEAAQ
jgi:hypothetical protein